MIDQIRSHNVLLDLVIWNNNKETLSFPGEEIDVYQGINDRGLYQRFLPSLLYPHKYVFFLDDDIVLGKNYCQIAVDVIHKNPNALVVNGGWVVEGMKRINGSFIGRKQDWHLDIGWMGCTVCLTDHVRTVLASKERFPKEGNEIHFNIIHQKNGGEVILPVFNGTDDIGIINCKLFENNLMGNYAYQKAKFDYLSTKCRENWSPRSHLFTEWQPDGEATLGYADTMKITNYVSNEQHSELLIDKTSDCSGVLIKPGDTLVSLLGGQWKEIYDHEVNTAFRKMFTDPNHVLPGFYIYRPNE